MSLRADSGVCRYCGAVMAVEKLRELEVSGAFDTYVCPGCDEEGQA